MAPYKCNARNSFACKSGSPTAYAAAHNNRRLIPRVKANQPGCHPWQPLRRECRAAQPLRAATACAQAVHGRSSSPSRAERLPATVQHGIFGPKLAPNEHLWGRILVYQVPSQQDHTAGPCRVVLSGFSKTLIKHVQTHAAAPQPQCCRSESRLWSHVIFP